MVQEIKEITELGLSASISEENSADRLAFLRQEALRLYPLLPDDCE